MVSHIGLEPGDPRQTLIALYDVALPDVFGYLASRCGSAAVAEDLTSETFLAAVDSVKRGVVRDLTVANLEIRSAGLEEAFLAITRADSAESSVA